MTSRVERPDKVSSYRWVSVGLWLFCSVAGYLIMSIAFLSFFPTLMLNSYDVSLRWSGGILALGVVVGGIAGLALGYISMATGKGKSILQALGILMAGTYVGMTLSGSIPVLICLSLLNGIAWGFFPILYTVPFHLQGIQPREVAVALAFTMMMTSAGTILGPLVTGFIQEALEGFRLALLIVSFAPLSLSSAGVLLRLSTERVAVKDTKMVH